MVSPKAFGLTKARAQVLARQKVFRHEFYLLGKNIPTAEPQSAQSLFFNFTLRPSQPAEGG
jgi:hypothetical protein